MIHFAADKMLKSKHAHPVLPLALIGAPFTLPESTDSVASAGNPTGARQDDAAPGNDLPTLDPALLALFPPPQPEMPAAPPTHGDTPTGPTITQLPDTAIILIANGEPEPQVGGAVSAALDGRIPTAVTLAPITTAAAPLATFAPPALQAAPQTVPGEQAPLTAPVPTSLAVPVAAQAWTASAPSVTATLSSAPHIAPGPLPVAVPLPLHFAASAELAATVGGMALAGSPLVSAPTAAPDAVHIPHAPPAPVPLPAHWQVAAAPGPVAATAAAPIVAKAAAPAFRRDEPGDRWSGATGVAGIAAAAPTAFAPVAGSAMIDLRQEQWPADMVAQIERLRDAADAADTSIRLLPDALGEVQVDVRQDGDTLHVRFTAEQPQTRALLQDAQPRLAEAAEARGLKLGQSGVDAGTHGQHRQPAPQRSSSTTNPVADRQEPADDDTRIA